MHSRITVIYLIIIFVLCNDIIWLIRIVYHSLGAKVNRYLIGFVKRGSIKSIWVVSYHDTMRWNPFWTSGFFFTHLHFYDFFYIRNIFCMLRKWKRRSIDTAKWILDSSIFYSIKSKYDKRLFVYFYIFPRSYLNLPVLHQKLFWASKENNFWRKTGKFR